MVTSDHLPTGLVCDKEEGVTTVPWRAQSSGPEGSEMVTSKLSPVLGPLFSLYFPGRGTEASSPQPHLPLPSAMQMLGAWEGGGARGREDNSASADHDWMEEDCIWLM